MALRSSSSSSSSSSVMSISFLLMMALLLSAPCVNACEPASSSPPHKHGHPHHPKAPPTVKPAPPLPPTPTVPSVPTPAVPIVGTPPPPPSGATCPVSLAKLGVCIPILGGVLGDPLQSNCCALLGLLGLDVEVCLCAAIDANVLGIVGIHAKVDVIATILTTCGRKVPPKLSCP